MLGVSAPHWACDTPCIHYPWWCSFDQQTQQTGSHAVIYFFRELERILTGLCLPWLCLPCLALAWLWLCLAVWACLACLWRAWLVCIHSFYLRERERACESLLDGLACALCRVIQACLLGSVLASGQSSTFTI